jgi:hypothetical protein
MPNIPTYQSQESPVTRGYSAQASGDPGKWAALQIAGRGLEDVARVGTHIVLQQQETAKKLKKLDDYRWANEAAQAEQLNIAKFMADPANETSEDFGDRVAAYTNSRFEQYSSGETAPSPEAHQMFKQQFDHIATQSQLHAIDRGANNKVNAIINSAKQANMYAVDAYRTMRGVDENIAIKNLTLSIAQSRAAIDAGIGQIAPEQAHRLHEDLITQSVLSVMTTNPAAAKSILNSSKDIDEQTRYRLNNEINQASRNIIAGHKNNVLEAAKGVESFARQGNEAQPLPLESFLDVMDEAHARAAHADHVEAMKTYNTGNMIVKAVSSFNLNEINKTINTLLKPSDINAENAIEKERLAQYTVKQLADIGQLQAKDTVGFLEQYNSHVRGSYDLASTIEDPQERSSAITAANSINLMYQGRAPIDAGTEERKQYLDRPDRHLLSNFKAEQIAKDINVSSPKDVVKKIGEILSAYPDENHASIVFNDLVSKGKLSQQYQIAWLNKDAPWIDTYLGSLKAGKDLNVPEKTMNDLSQAVWNDDTFALLRNTITRDNFQGSRDVAGFFDGAKSFAAALVSEGRSVKEAVSAATSMIITEQLGFTGVNGVPLMILKKDQNGKMRNTDEINGIGQSLKYALELIPVHEIETSAFNATPGFSALNDEKKLKAIGFALNNHAYWQTTSNGQGAMLYYKDPSGIQNFQLRDKENKPFVVHFKDLPKSVMDAPGEWARQAMYATRAGATSFAPRREMYNTTNPRPYWMTAE